MSTQNDPYIIEEDKEVLIDQNLLGFLWYMFFVFAYKIPENILLNITKEEIDSVKNIGLFLGKHENDFFMSRSCLQKIKPENIVRFNFRDLILGNFVGKWHKISEKKPSDKTYILGALYECVPAVLRVDKNKYYIVIPGESNKENKDIYVEVTKGLKYWTLLPDHIQAFD